MRNRNMGSNSPIRQENSLFFSIDEANYVAWEVHQALSTTTLLEYGVEFQRLVSFPLGQQDVIDGTWLDAHIADCLKLDDVFRVEFLQNILLISHSCVQVPDDVMSLAKERWGTQTIKSVIADESTLSSGLYVTCGRSLYKVYRLFDDLQGTFLISTQPGTEG